MVGIFSMAIEPSWLTRFWDYASAVIWLLAILGRGGLHDRTFSKTLLPKFREKG